MMSQAIAESAAERLHRIARCQRAVTDLMIPSEDLHICNRDRLATLLEFLAEEQQKALDRLQASD